MKRTVVNKKFRQADVETLSNEERQLREEYFRLRINIATSHVKKTSQFKELRRNIARALTIKSEKDSLGKIS
jgi:ribosomal protein L29